MRRVAATSVAALLLLTSVSVEARTASRRAQPAAPVAVREPVLPTEAPLPVPRPKDLDAPANPAPAPAPEPVQANEPAKTPDKSLAEPDCPARLRAAGWDIEPAQSTSSRDACAIEVPIRLHKIPATHFSTHDIVFPDHPLLACRFAEKFGAWVRDLAAPLVYGHAGVELTDIRTGPGAECRNRNHAVAGKISAHASGIAIDLMSFDLADKSRVTIPATDPRGMEILASLRTAACGWFTTILGPGTDPDHATHLHVDILQHGTSAYYRICE